MKKEELKGQVKLVVCDIDGTLTTTDNRFTDFTKETINKMHDLGIGFGLASGRSCEQLTSVAYERWGIQWPLDMVIGVNGGELLDQKTNTIYQFYPLETSWIKEILDMLAPFEHLNPFIYRDNQMLCKKAEEGIIASSLRNKMPFSVVDDLKELYREPCGKLLVRVSEEEREYLLDYFNNQHPSKYYHAFKTQTTMIEFMDKRVNKGVALKEYCRINNIDINNVVAFGDMQNDNHLLQEAGFGICMLNGSDETKSYADDISIKTNDEDGVADYLLRYII